jgi:hypothetical protein
MWIPNSNSSLTSGRARLTATKQGWMAGKVTKMSQKRLTASCEILLLEQD